MRRLLPTSSEYRKNTLISVLGVVASAVIPMLFVPVLSRMFTPEDFSLTGLFVFVVSIMAMVVNLRYSQAVAVANNEQEATDILVGSIWLSAFFSVLTFVLFYFFGDYWIDQLGYDPRLKNWILFSPISIFFLSVSISINGWLNQKKQFSAMAVNKSVRRLTEGVAQLILGAMKFRGGLIVGTLIGDFANYATHYFQLKNAKGNLRKSSFQAVRSALKKFADFPKYNLFPSLLDNLSLYLPFLIINSYYSDSTGGQFYQARQVLGLPLVLISMAISQVLLQKLSENRNTQKPIWPIIKKHALVLGALSILGLIVLFFFAEPLFDFVLGGQWTEAGRMTSIMVIAYAFKFVITPLSSVFFALHKVKLSSAWQISYFVGMLLLFFLTDFGIMDFIWFYVLIEVVAYVIYFVLIYKVANDFDRGLINRL